MAEDDIVLASAGRFHYASLARELQRQGRLRAFYSGFDRRRLQCPDIPRHKLRTKPFPQIPSLALGRLGLLPAALQTRAQHWSKQTLGRYIRDSLPDCQHLVAMSSCATEAIETAKARGIRYSCERSSQHIQSVDQILRQEHQHWGLPYPDIDTKIIERELIEYELADRIIVLSERSRQSFQPYGIDLNKIRVVPAPIAPSLPKLNTVPKRNKGRIQLLFVGALSVQKGLGRLLRAYAQQTHPHSQLTIIGARSPETAKILAQAPHQDVQFLAPMAHRQLAHHYATADLLIVPSIQDGLPLTTFEALNYGCPVLISDHAGASEYIDHGRNGLIYPGRDQQALTEQLQRLLDQPQLLQTLQHGARHQRPPVHDQHHYLQRWIESLP